jgi:hypothetical protein
VRELAVTDDRSAGLRLLRPGSTSAGGASHACPDPNASKAQEHVAKLRICSQRKPQAPPGIFFVLHERNPTESDIRINIGRPPLSVRSVTLCNIKSPESEKRRGDALQGSSRLSSGLRSGAGWGRLGRESHLIAWHPSAPWSPARTRAAPPTPLSFFTSYGML